MHMLNGFQSEDVYVVNVISQFIKNSGIEVQAARVIDLHNVQTLTCPVYLF